MASQQERLAWMKEHLSYEVLMLRYTMSKIQVLPEGLDWNAYYESFCTHARLLRDFINNDQGQNNFKAKEFIVGFHETIPKPLGNVMSAMNAQVFHPGKSRPSKQEEKVHAGKAREVYDWIEGAMGRFEGRLEEPFKKVWKVAPRFPKAPTIAMKLAERPSTSNHVQSVASTSLATTSMSYVTIVR